MLPGPRGIFLALPPLVSVTLTPRDRWAVLHVTSLSCSPSPRNVFAHMTHLHSTTHHTTPQEFRFKDGSSSKGLARAHCLLATNLMESLLRLLNLN